MTSPVSRLAAEDLVKRVSVALPHSGTWLVGGAVRDAALGRPVTDLDLAVDGDPRETARALAFALDGHPFELSADHGTWRVVPRNDRSWQADITRLRGASIEQDLAARDFTVGAMAVPLTALDAPESSSIVDPLGGLDDLQRGLIRVASPTALLDDPLRLIRLCRLAADLELRVEPETAGLARRYASYAVEAAGERIFDELRLLISSGAPVRGIELLDEVGVLGEILPEVTAMRGVEQGPNHHLDVFDHTLEVLRQAVELTRDVGALLTPGRMPPDVEAERLCHELNSFLAEPLAAGVTRTAALRLGALFHDVGKPVTRAVRDGFIGFPGHDRKGAEIIRGTGRRLAMSSRLTSHLSDLALHHLRLGFLIPSMPLSARDVHAYLTDTGSVAVDVTLLTVADRLSARGSGTLASEGMVEAHLDLAAKMTAEALRIRREGMPEPLLRGDEIATAVGIQPGPELGRLVAELEAAQYAGEVTDREQAIAHLRSYRAR